MQFPPRIGPIHGNILGLKNVAMKTAAGSPPHAQGSAAVEMLQVAHAIHATWKHFPLAA
jgi:hypothetical protein